MTAHLETVDSADALLARLAEVSANLTRYIEDRAWEIARPRIAATEHEAREQMADFAGVVADLRAHIAALEQQIRDLTHPTVGSTAGLASLTVEVAP